MAKGEQYPIERIEFDDAETKARVIQLTSMPIQSWNLYFEETPFTPDSSRLIFRSHRPGTRRERWDLFRVDSDGDNLVQLTDRDDMGDAVLAPDGQCAYFTAGRAIHRLALDDAKEDTIAGFDGTHSLGQITVGGKYVFAQVRETSDRAHIVRWSIDGNVEAIHEGRRFGHVTGSPSGNWLSLVDVTESSRINHQTWYVMRPDGTEHRRWAVPNWSHTAWRGLTDRMQGTLLPPGRAIVEASPDPSPPREVCGGPYFWHSSSSHDGEWLVSDTNWPNIGLHLIHAPSGRYRLLCRDGSSAGHPERTHPHPVMSGDGTRVLFNSDRTGINQVYLALIPEWMKDELREANDG